MEPIIEDNEKSVRELLKRMYGTDYIDPDIVDADPHAPFVWLAIDTKKKIAMVVYLGDFDAEQIPFKGDKTSKYIP